MARKIKRKIKRRINRKVKALNNEVKRLELLMKQRQLMTLGNFGGGGGYSAPISTVSTNLAQNDLKNELANQKDKIQTEIVQYRMKLADIEQKNADNLADIEQKHNLDNAYIDNTLADHRSALQNGLLYVAHLGSRIDNVEVPRISTRSQTPQPTRTRDNIFIDRTPHMASSASFMVRQDPTIDDTIESIIAPISKPREWLTKSEMRQRGYTKEQIEQDKMTADERKEIRRNTMRGVNENRGKKS